METRIVALTRVGSDSREKCLKALALATEEVKQEVQVTESYIPEFSVSTFLAGLGGSLGLWLGVGAVQLIGVGVSILDWA